MSKESYWFAFMNIDMTKEEKILFENALNPTDYEGALIGDW